MTMQNQINFTFFVHHHFQLNHHPNLISNFNFPFCERTNLHLNGIGFVVLYHAGFYPIPFDFIEVLRSFSKSNGLSPLKTTRVRLSSLKSKVQIAMKPRHHVYSKNLSNLQSVCACSWSERARYPGATRWESQEMHLITDDANGCNSVQVDDQMQARDTRCNHLEEPHGRIRLMCLSVPSVVVSNAFLRCFTCLCTLGFCLPIPVSGKCGFTQVREHRKSKYQAATHR